MIFWVLLLFLYRTILHIALLPLKSLRKGWNLSLMTLPIGIEPNQFSSFLFNRPHQRSTACHVRLTQGLCEGSVTQ